MKNSARHLVLAGLSAFVCFFSFCTIKDDNGNPVDPGNTVVNPSDPSAVPGLNVFPDSNYVSVDSTIRIHVQLFSDVDSPIRSAQINVGTNLGTLSSNRVTTDANGWATVYLKGTKEGTAEVTFKYSGMRQTAFIEITDTPPRNIIINASPSVLLADGSSSSIITVQVKNDNNNPIVGDSIRFSSSAGMITAASVTDIDGKATAKLTSDRRNTIAVVEASLKNDAKRSTKINVEFSGVTISAAASPASIKPTGDTTKDFSTVLITLLDAAGNPIVGERVIFSNSKKANDLFSRDSTTNSRGEARCKIASKDSKTDTVTIAAAGANATAIVTFSKQNLTVVPAPANQSFIANPTLETTFEITYTNGSGNGISGATLEVSVTMGTTVKPVNDTVFACSLKTGTGGKTTFKMQNPSFTSLATIFVKAYSGNEFTTASHTQYFQASEVKRIELSGTPGVISINGQTAKITATAFDERGNRVKGAIISFNMLSGPGGGEYLDPATATTAADGTAVTYLISGTIPSFYKGVHVKASDFADNESETINFTIAGPPKSITINRNMGELVSYPAAYGKKIAALVSDVNGNPVADGTEVTFSAQTSGYVFFRLQPYFYEDSYGNPAIRIDTIGYVIESEWLNQSRPYSPFPYFNDINWSGVPERWSPDLSHPDNRGLRNNPIKPCHPARLFEVSGRMRCDGPFADYNSTGEWDTVKTIYGSFTSAERDALYNAGNAVIANGYSQGAYTNWDLDWIGNGVPEPQSTVLITRTTLTKDGIADNELVYGQSAAWRYQVKVYAECQGFTTSSPEQFILPLEEDARKYWSYR